MARQSTFSYEQVNILSNNIGPRLSGSPQAAAAVRYVAKEMGEIGLDVRLEPVTVRRWVRGKEEAALIRYPGQVNGADQRIVVTALGNAVPTPDVGVTAPIVLVNSFEELEQLPVDQVQDKVVFFNFPFDRFAARAGRWEQAYGAAVQYRSYGAVRAAKKGAVAILVRSAGSGMLRLAHTGVTRYEEGIPQIPAGSVPAEDGDLISTLAKQGAVEIHLLLTPKECAPEQSYNVVADLKGRQLPE